MITFPASPLDRVLSIPPQATHLLDYINLAALALSPLIAVLVAARLQELKERRQQRFWIFQSLMTTRNDMANPEHVRALNMIDVVFAKSPRVRSLWHELFAMLNNTGLNDPTDTHSE